MNDFMTSLQRDHFKKHFLKQIIFFFAFLGSLLMFLVKKKKKRSQVVSKSKQ